MNGFGPFDGRVWLNTAHQGPLPQCAASEADDAVAEKVAPHRISDESFFELPRQVKATLAQLIGADAGDLVLGNSTTYGLHLLAHGLPLERGDEVLLVEGDFPATIVPWLPLESHGVRVRVVTPRERPITPEQLADEIGPRTRVLCLSWVFSFTGEAIDVDAIGAVCRERGVVCVINGSQAVGARLVDLSTAPIDALVCCGFKWLCGPYATGFCWLRPELAERLTYEQAYWLAQIEPGDLSQEMNVRLDGGLGPERWDVFGTANFLNFRPWKRALEFLLDRGAAAIERHDQALVTRLVDGLEDSGWELVSPAAGPSRSTLVVIRGADEEAAATASATLAEAGLDVAVRAGAIRISPHLHNSEKDIDRLLDALHAT